MSEKKKILTIEDWAGGLSDGSKYGIDGSFRFGQGLDFKKYPDSITSALALAKSSGTTMTGMPKWIKKYDGNEWLFFYDENGVIYREASGGFALLKSVTSSGGQGMDFYDDYLYYAQDSQIGRYGPMSGATFTDNWQTGLNGTTEWRPVLAFQNLLCVGNGRYLATWDGSVWNATKLTFPPRWSVRDIAVRGDYLAIAVNDSAVIDDSNSRAVRGVVFYWDGTSSNYNFFSEIPEGGGISSIQASQEKLYIFPGSYGNIYVDTGRITKIKRIPYMGQGNTLYVYPGGTCNFNGLLTFGVAGGTSTTAYRGVYEYGSIDNNYSKALNLSYPLSTGTVTGTGVSIGAVFPFNQKLYVGWKDGSSYGYDTLSTSVQQTTTYYESRVISFSKEASIERIKVICDTLASGDSIDVDYKADREATWKDYGTLTFASDGAITKKALQKNIRATDFEIRLTLTSGPTIYKIIIEYNEEARL